MSSRLGGFVLTIASAALVCSAACSNDYDYEFVDQPGSGASGGSAGSGGSGGVTIGGTGGILGGSGGIVSGGTGGTPGGTGGTPTGGTGGGGCPVGQKTCNATCVDTTDPQYGCGTSGCDPCVIANAQVQCVTNLCALFDCNAGFDNCNNDLTDGCESTLDTTDHCGSCTRACSTTNSTGATCAANKCSHTCQPGFGDCTQPLSPTADNGCESDLSSSATACGSCTNNCTTQGFPPAGFGCSAGACACASSDQCREADNVSGATCDTGTGICSCGGTACKAGEACAKSGGTSVCRCNKGAACTGGQTCCPTSGCKLLISDAANCGICGHACPTGFVCNVGACACDGDGDCDAGSPGTCAAGVCTCGTTVCTAGQRCTAAGTCG